MASTSTGRISLWSTTEMLLPSCCDVRRSEVVSVVHHFGKWDSQRTSNVGSRRGTAPMATTTAKWQQRPHAQEFYSAAPRSWASASASPRLELPDGLQTSHLSTFFGSSRVKRRQEAAADTRCYKGLGWIASHQMRRGSNSDFSSSEAVQNVEHFDLISWRTPSLSALLGLSAALSYSEAAHASSGSGISNPAYGDVGVVLEAGVQLLYLGALLILLGVGSFLVVRQVLIKRELESAAKDLQDRVRKGDASSLEYFELGAVMLRKKFNQLARKYLNEAINKWDGSQQDLAQVYNALGYSYFNDGKIDLAVGQYEKAVKLQPTYVTAWNNLADAYETQSKFSKALKAYEEALQFDPSNKIASAKREQMRRRVEKFQGIQ